MDNRRIKLSEEIKQKLQINADENNLHVTFRGGVSGVIDNQTGRIIIERSKKFDKNDVRSVFGINSIFAEKSVLDKKSRPSLSHETFSDPNAAADWSDWSYENSNSL